MRRRCPGVYAVVNVVTGERYVGSSRDINARCERHVYHLNKGIEHNSNLQRAWGAYGPLCFSFNLLEYASHKGPRLDAEQRHIELGAAYNIRKSARSTYQAPSTIMLLRQQGVARAAIVSAAKKELWKDPEYRARAIASMKGVKKKRRKE